MTRRLDSFWTCRDVRRAGPGGFRPAWSHPGTAQEPRRRPTEGPREAPDSPTRHQEASRGAQTRQGAISKRFWRESGPPGTSKNLTKCCTVDDFRGFRNLARKASTEAQNAPKGAPREAHMSPRRAPGGPRSAPRAPQTAPRGAWSAPRGAHDHPGAPEERAKRSPSRPNASREAFQSPCRSIWGAPGGSFSSPLGVLSEACARYPTQTNKKLPYMRCTRAVRLAPARPLRALARCLSIAPARSAGAGARRLRVASARLDTSLQAEAVNRRHFYVCACL